VVALDLDRFKAINDTHGHATGDHVLRGVGYRIRHALGPHDLAYRLGGEEFAILMPARGVDDACGMAERLRGAIGGEPIAGLAVRTSVGVAASAPGEPFVWDAVFGRADEALYEAKRSGRDRVVVFEGAAAPPLAAAA
jgi:diguanylate cyclase (GGDEF)-like protein